MKRFAMVLGCLAVPCATAAHAVELDPNVRAKAVLAASASPAAVSIPSNFANRASSPDLVNGVDADGRTFNGACSASRAEVCYDYKDGRLVYRNWMPDIGGFTPEALSIRRDKVIFTYSFR
jgi:hypothetical protein